MANTRKSTAARKPKIDAFEAVTSKILAALESGVAPWRKPWDSVTGVPMSLSSGKPYRGVNALLLGLEAQEKGYASPYWMTFNQMKQRNGHLKEGQKGTLVTFWKMLKVEDEATGEKKTIPMLRYFYVFNADQMTGVEGVPEVKVTPRDLTPAERHAAADAIWEAWEGKPEVRHAGDSAYYVPSLDAITLPPVDTFHSLDEYHATRFHEGGHSTGHESRLDRKFPNQDGFGSHGYGREELVAEMTAAFLCAEAGIETTQDNSAAYLASWIKTIKEDPRAVVVAAGAAQKAANLILGRVTEPKTEESEEPALASASA